MPSETPLQRLASHVLGEPVGPWIRERRQPSDTCPSCGAPAPQKKSWREISEELRGATNGAIDVPFQTLINWSPDHVVDEPAAAAS